MEPHTPIPPAPPPASQPPLPPTTNNSSEKWLIGIVIVLGILILFSLVRTGPWSPASAPETATPAATYYTCPIDETQMYVCAFEAYFNTHPEIQAPSGLITMLEVYRYEKTNNELVCPDTIEELSACYTEQLVEDVASKVEYYQAAGWEYEGDYYAEEPTTADEYYYDDYEYPEEYMYEEPTHDADQFLTYPAGNEIFCYGDFVEVSWQAELAGGEMVDVLLVTPQETVRLDTVRANAEFYIWNVRPTHTPTTGLTETHTVPEGALYKIKLLTEAGATKNESDFFEITWCGGYYHDEYDLY